MGAAKTSPIIVDDRRPSRVRWKSGESTARARGSVGLHAEFAELRRQEPGAAAVVSYAGREFGVRTLIAGKIHAAMPGGIPAIYAPTASFGGRPGIPYLQRLRDGPRDVDANTGPPCRPSP